MPTKKYRVAVVGGAGTWGRRYLRAYANHPDCEIIALVDRARDRVFGQKRQRPAANTAMVRRGAKNRDRTRLKQRRQVAKFRHENIFPILE